MESVKVTEWVTEVGNSGSGSGSGQGSGYGYHGFGQGPGGFGFGYHGFGGFGFSEGQGSGSSYGFGKGQGSGYNGSGSDFGYHGFGYGYGYGIKEVNGQAVYMVDGVATMITAVKLNLAKGFILNIDFTLNPCYIVKGNGYFAHGETIKKAQQELQDKIFENMDTDEAIEQFVKKFKAGKKYSGHEFFEWHHYLTGSCEMGRKSFVSDHGLCLDDMFTVTEFIELCKDSYGGEIIRRLKERYEE